MGNTYRIWLGSLVTISDNRFAEHCLCFHSEFAAKGLPERVANDPWVFWMCFMKFAYLVLGVSHYSGSLAYGVESPMGKISKACPWISTLYVHYLYFSHLMYMF